MLSLIKKFRDVILLSIMFLTFLLSKFFPLRDQIWVFGAYNKKGFGDNSKYFYLYISNNCPDITAVWIGDENIDQLQSAGYTAYHTRSFAASRAMLFANTAFVSHGIYDLNWWFSGGTTIVNLWHGTPIKKIESDRNDDLVSRLKRRIRTISGLEYDYLCLTGKNVLPSFESAYNMSSITPVVTGYPRNDVISQEVKDSSLLCENHITQVEDILIECEHAILYAPTFRDDESFKLFDHWPDLNTVDAVLSESDGHLFIKLHPHERLTPEFSNFDNISVLPQHLDVYPVLNQVDCLITDYSSIYVDYLLTGGHIIFYSFDLEKYTSERGFYYRYEDITPGPVVQGPQELLEEIQSIRCGQESYGDERLAIREKFFDEVDGQSSQRIYEYFSRALSS